MNYYRYPISWSNLRTPPAGKRFTPGNYVLKRGLDIGLSLVMLLLVLSWLLPILVILILLMDGSPAFFVQERIGWQTKRFRCLKLRTIGTRKSDRRKIISPLGRFLRSNKLDELPQFINVLKGEMSIVGPRPHMELDHHAFSRQIGQQYHLRHWVKPGITGLAQIKGYEGPIVSFAKLRGRIRLDLFYIRNWSIGLDLWILWQTVLYFFRSLLRNR